MIPSHCDWYITFIQRTLNYGEYALTGFAYFREMLQLVVLFSRSSFGYWNITKVSNVVAQSIDATLQSGHAHYCGSQLDTSHVRAIGKRDAEQRYAFLFI